jgi:hypothetical protein
LGPSIMIRMFGRNAAAILNGDRFYFLQSLLPQISGIYMEICKRLDSLVRLYLFSTDSREARHRRRFSNFPIRQ